MQTLEQQKQEIAFQSQRGLTFIMGATVYWLTVGISALYFSPQAAFMLSVWATGILFPLSLLFAKVLNINVFFKNPNL